jgi:hypothetical protein
LTIKFVQRRKSASSSRPPSLQILQPSLDLLIADPPACQQASTPADL